LQLAIARAGGTTFTGHGDWTLLLHLVFRYLPLWRKELRNKHRDDVVGDDLVGVFVGGAVLEGNCDELVDLVAIARAALE